MDHRINQPVVTEGTLNEGPQNQVFEAKGTFETQRGQSTSSAVSLAPSSDLPTFYTRKGEVRRQSRKKRIIKPKEGRRVD